MFQVNSTNQLSTTLQYNDKFQPVRNAQGTSAPLYNIASTYIQNGPFWIAKGQGNRILNSKATFDVSGNNYGYTIRDSANSTQTRWIDTASGNIRGADPTAEYFRRKLWQVTANLSYYTPSLFGGSHNFKFGYGWMLH